MTRFVIGPDVALHLAAERAVVSADHQLVAPALLRSQVLTLLYEAVARGDLSRKDASAQARSPAGAADAAARRPRAPGERVAHRG